MRARAELGDVERAIERGEFAPLVDWLRARVHGRGRLVGGLDLVEEATDQPLGTRAFKAHLERRYLDR
jgi:carboxypeptidase Taq